MRLSDHRPQVGVLPAEGAAEAAVAGPTAQAAGAEDVVAVQQARGLVLLVAQRAHQRVHVAAVRGAKAVRVGEDPACHLSAEASRSKHYAGRRAAVDSQASETN